MANTATIKVLVDDAALEKLVNKSQQSAKIIRGGFDIATGAAAVFGEKSSAAMEKLANRSIIVANTFNGIEDLIEGLAKQEGFLKVAQKIGVGKEAVEGFAKALPGIGIAATLVLPLVTEYWDDIAGAIGMSTEQTLLNSEAIGKAAEKFTSLKTDVEVLVSEYNNSNTSLQRQKEIVGELSEISPNYFSTAISNTDQLTAAQDKFNAAILRQITLEGAKSLIAEKQKDFLNENIQLLQEIAALEARDPVKYPALNEAQKEQDRKNASRLKDLKSEFKEREKLFTQDVKGLLNVATTAQTNLEKLGGKVDEKVKANAKKTAKVVNETIKEELSILEPKILGEEALVEPISEEDKKKLSNAISLALLGVTEEVRQQMMAEPRPMSVLDLITPTPQQVTDFELTFEESLDLASEKMLKFLNDPKFKASLEAFYNIGNALMDNLNARMDALSNMRDKSIQELDKAEKAALQRAGDNAIARESIEAQFAKKRLGIEEEFTTKSKEIQKKQANLKLAIDIANIATSQAKAIAEALALGPIIGPILAVVIGAAAGVQLATAIKQRNEVAKLAQGGILAGPSHSAGGIYMGGGVEAEGGEAVINRRSTMAFGGLLSTINQAGGGAPLLTNTGVGTSSTSQANSIIDYGKLAAAIGAVPTRAYVVTQDITLAQDKQTAIRSKATIA